VLRSGSATNSSAITQPVSEPIANMTPS